MRQWQEWQFQPYYPPYIFNTENDLSLIQSRGRAGNSATLATDRH